MNIVIVEDEDNARQGLIRLIDRLSEKYVVIGEAADGQTGYSLICKLRPDLVITDIKMPKMSGIDMLSKLNSYGYRQKAVVLTGYSEYEYAKKALKLGVADYLEKPITVDDLKTILEKIEQDLIYEKLGGLPNRPPHEQTEQLIRHTLFQETVDPSLLSFHLQQAEGFNPDIPFQIVQIYSNAHQQEVMDLFSFNKAKLALRFPTVVFTVPNDKSIYLLMQTDMTTDSFDEWLSTNINGLMRECDLSVVVSRIEIPCLSELKAGFIRLNQLRRWSISNVSASILSEKIIAQLEVQPFQYSENFDNRVALAIAESSQEEITKIFDDWLKFVWDQKKYYYPQQIIDATIRLITNLVSNIAIHYGNDVAITKQNEWLNQIWGIQTKLELRETLDEISKQISAIQKKTSYSLVVLKALKIIYERYNDGVTLDEISNSLHITPEYLSTIFTKEVGKTYTSFIKELRINKAKELLKCSELKTFEIAKEVGYPDAKYFSRVFKDATGLSPGDYQRLHRGP